MKFQILTRAYVMYDVIIKLSLGTFVLLLLRVLLYQYVCVMCNVILLN